jgi:nitrate reductase gamma subunit
MTLLDFARGPALQWAFVVFVLGILWRLGGIFVLARRRDLSTPRNPAALQAGMKTLVTHSWPRPEFFKYVGAALVLGYIFHVGLAIVVLAYGPHIEFLQGLFGVSWPALPNGVILVTGAVTVAAIVVLWLRRLTHPVLKFISNFDDHFSLFVAIAPLITGFMATAHLGGRYETVLAIHILSIALLLVWFPFGKLMHGFFIAPGRIRIGSAFGRKGVEV